MIQRHIKRPTEDDFKSFDFFNDAKDTIEWLSREISASSEKSEQLHLRLIKERLESEFDKFTEDFIKRKRS